MAGEEDVELRDLVAQTLEAKGVLGKIRVSFHVYFYGASGTNCFNNHTKNGVLKKKNIKFSLAFKNLQTFQRTEGPYHTLHNITTFV